MVTPATKSKGRGKQLSLVDRSDGVVASREWVDVRMRQLVEAAHMLAMDKPALRQAAQKVLREAAAAWALHDRDRVNQAGRPIRTETYRNDDVRLHHARLVNQGLDATSDTATYFGLSRRQVQRIVKPKALKT